MEPDVDELVLVPSHEHKLLVAVAALRQARDHLLAAAANAIDSSNALENQAAQASRRSGEVMDEATRLIARAERLVAEAKAIQGERMPVAQGLRGAE